MSARKKTPARLAAFREMLGHYSQAKIAEAIGVSQGSVGNWMRAEGLYANLSVTHGSAGRNKTGAYASWSSMRTRCLNPKASDFYRYGGRGIKICSRWDSFGSFLADMGERPKGLTLERIDNAADYGPGNCKWATYAEQSRNRRCTKLDAAKVEIIRAERAQGVLLTDLADRFGVSFSLISQVARGSIWKEAA